LKPTEVARQARLLVSIGRKDLAHRLLSEVPRQHLTEDLRTTFLLLEHQINGLAGLRAELQNQLLHQALGADTTHAAVKVLASAGLAFAKDDQNRDCTSWLRYGLTKNPNGTDLIVSLAFLLSQRGALEDLIESRQLINGILGADSDEISLNELHHEDLRILSRTIRNLGDSANSVKVGKLSLNKRPLSSPGRAFLHGLESLKLLPTFLMSEDQRHDALAAYEVTLDNLISAGLPSKTERQPLLEGLLEISNFYVPYLAQSDLGLSKKYADVNARLSGFFDFEGKREVTTQKKILVLGNFRQHTGVFVFNFLSKLITSSDWAVDLVNVGDSRDLGVPECFRNKISAFNFPLNPATYDALLSHLRNQHYLAAFFPEVGMSPESRFMAFHRLAPIQFTSWLHPVSTASNEIDFFVTGEAMEPPRGQDHYSEKLVSLSGIGQDFFAHTMRSKNPSQPQRGRLVCIQSPFKIQPFFDTWLQKIVDLKEVVEIYFLRPNAPYQRDVLEERLLALRGNTKIKFFDRLAPDKFVEFLTSCDLALDLPNWSGGNTSIDCFRANLPVLCFEGQKMRSRHTFAMYSVMGLPELLTARSQDEYVELVERLVSDRELNSLCRESIRRGLPRLVDSGSRAPDELYDWLCGAVS
jgi:hypothetical protein